MLISKCRYGRRMKDQLDVTCYFFFHFLCAQHVSDINISIIRSLRLCCWITTSVVLFSVRCVLDMVRLVLSGARFAGWSTLSEICWAHKKWNKITSDIKMVFHSSTITMMYGPINIRFEITVWILSSHPLLSPPVCTFSFRSSVT